MPRAYHHGNLKQALLRAALELIRQAGPHGLTLREAARRAGVSHNAPYRHFRDRDELLAEVAAEGFERLTKSMNQAAARGTSPVERFERSGWGYVHFALRYPEHFTVMFDRPSLLKVSPHCKEASEKAFEMLLGFVRDCQGVGALPPGDPRPFALMAWSVVHGVSKLAVSGHLPFSSQAGVLEFTTLLTNTLALGMALTPQSQR
ncbi:MAG: TetR/AcrR family transcriptional regulator [Candidatus Acidiferrales bacterium]